MIFVCKKLGCSKEEFAKMVNTEITDFGFGKEYLIK